MKFTIDAKEFKNLTKGIMKLQNDKESYCDVIKLSVESGRLFVTVGNNIEQYCKVNCDNVYHVEDGELFIDNENMNILLNMNGEITFETKDNIAKIINGNKVIKIIPCNNSIEENINRYEKIEKENAILHIITMKECWLYETLDNLYSALNTDGSNKLLGCYNFNLKDNRVEALDGHFVSIRKMEQDNNIDGNILLNGVCLNTLKYTLNKKSDDSVSVIDYGKYVGVCGGNFRYIQMKIDGIYFDVNKILNFESEWETMFDKEDILNVMTYDYRIVGKDKKPVVIYNKDNNTYVCLDNNKNKFVDKIETWNNTMKNEYAIGFNPKFFINALTSIDVDEVRMCGSNYRSPVLLYGNEYWFLILPVNIVNSDMKMEERIYELNRMVM